MIDTNLFSAGKQFAMVQGRPLSQIPGDLYIPPDALEISLDDFEGPLDLLLYLIKRDDLDISELEIAPITDQYMSYLNLMNELNINLAAEYLVMAAMLAEIKSRILLPRVEEESEEEDPRAELIRRLRFYQQFKLASEKLDAIPRMERNWYDAVVSLTKPIVRPLPTADVVDLQKAIEAVMSRFALAKAHFVDREKLSVSDRMNRVLGLLKKQRLVPFQQLFESQEGRSGVVVSLVAILELAKNQMVSVLQNNASDKIYIKRVAEGETFK